jgi:hypothetical protein
MSRRDRQEVFHDDLESRRFSKDLGGSQPKDRVAGHSYCLMSNHFHLVVETPRAIWSKDEMAARHIYHAV